MRGKAKLLLSLGVLSLFVVPALWTGTASGTHAIMDTGSLIHSSLVNAYEEAQPGNCVLNDTHNGPLANPSCNSQGANMSQTEPPRPVGTPGKIGALRMGCNDKNQHEGAKGDVTVNIKEDDPATVAPDADAILTAHMENVQQSLDPGCGTDYDPPGAPDGLAIATIRITDADCVGKQAGNHCTMQETPFAAPLFCTPTPTKPTVGSTCRVSTTANSTVPGVVKVGTHGNVQVNRIRILDTTNTLSAMQGLWFP